MLFINHNCDPIIKEWSIFSIMNAEDMLIFSESVEGLQNMFDA